MTCDGGRQGVGVRALDTSSLGAVATTDDGCFGRRTRRTADWMSCQLAASVGGTLSAVTMKVNSSTPLPVSHSQVTSSRVAGTTARGSRWLACRRHQAAAPDMRCLIPDLGIAVSSLHDR